MCLDMIIARKKGVKDDFKISRLNRRNDGVGPNSDGQDWGRVAGEEQVFCLDKFEMPGNYLSVDVLMTFAYANLGFNDMVQIGNRNLHV